MITIYTISALIAAYLIGSIPTAVLIGKIFYKVDIREHGSGNSGASNTFRVLGVKAGIPVMLIDMLKGFFACSLAHLIGGMESGTEQYVNFQLVLGITAVIGHVYPIFAGFQGGKGIATLFGIILAIHPAAALSCVVVFVVVLLITKYVSLSSIACALSFPFLLIFVFKTDVRALIIFSLAVMVLVILTHRENIERLRKGEENSAGFLTRKK
ncbi:MAG: glycerol-3-phosphate acyltransferase PlsY [Sphingobacteriales bacterium]